MIILAWVPEKAIIGAMAKAKAEGNGQKALRTTADLTPDSRNARNA
ncbi:MAG: hypothetical protein ABSC11_15520 [Smithella sp.]